MLIVRTTLNNFPIDEVYHFGVNFFVYLDNNLKIIFIFYRRTPPMYQQVYLIHGGTKMTFQELLLNIDLIRKC